MLISVIIPTYNRFDLVNQAIYSALQQTYQDYEIIVVDDCSQDKDYEKLVGRSDIRYFRLDKRSGLPAVVRNFGIKESLGEWVAFLDDDDYWLPNKLEAQMKWTDKYDFICSDAYCQGRLWIGDINLGSWKRVNPENTKQLDNNLMRNHNLIINSSVLIRKKILESVGGIPECPSLRGVEDYTAWLKVLERNHFCFFVNEGLLDYNISSHKYLRDNYV